LLNTTRAIERQIRRPVAALEAAERATGLEVDAVLARQAGEGVWGGVQCRETPTDASAPPPAPAAATTAVIAYSAAPLCQ